jgi:hypothetical protein
MRFKHLEIVNSMINRFINKFKKDKNSNNKRRIVTVMEAYLQKKIKKMKRLNKIKMGMNLEKKLMRIIINRLSSPANLQKRTLR